MAGSINFPRIAVAAENDRAVPADSFSQQKDALNKNWESTDKAFTAALSVYGTSKDELNGYVARRNSVSDQAKAWNKKVSRAGLFLPRLSFDVSEDKHQIKDYVEFIRKTADLEKAADRPMDMKKADALFAELQIWVTNGKISIAWFVEQAVKIKTRGRENADLTCRLILAADPLKAQEIFDMNSTELGNYLTSKKYTAVRGLALGYASREKTSELLASAADTLPININAAEFRSDSAANVQAREKQASLKTLAIQSEKDRIENDRIVWLTNACAAFDSLRDPAMVKKVSEQFFRQMKEHNADSDDRKVMEAKRDNKIKELAAQAEAARQAEALKQAQAAAQAQAAQKAEAAARAEALKQAKAAAQAEAARQKAEEQRGRIMADADAALATKRYEQAATLINNYRAAGGDAAIADQKMNRIIDQRNADIEQATKVLLGDLQDALRRALRAANTSDIKAEMAKLEAVPHKIKQRGADSLKVSQAVANAFKRLEPLWVLALKGDSLKAAWNHADKSFTRALSVSGASKEELRKYSVDRSTLSLNAKAWNKKVSQDEADLLKLTFDATGDDQNIKSYLDFSAKVAALKIKSAHPMSFEKADTLVAEGQALAKNERIKISGSDTIVANIKFQAGKTAAKTDSAITAAMAADPLKAQEMLNQHSFYLQKYGTQKAYNALRERLHVQIQANDTRRFINKRMGDFRYLLVKVDIPRAQGVLETLDSAIRVLRSLSAIQAKPYSDTLKAFESALDANKSALMIQAKRAKDTLLVLQKRSDSLRVADSLRTAVIKTAMLDLYKVQNSAQVESILRPYLETLGRLQADKFNPEAMKDLKKQIAEHTHTLVSREKTTARTEALEQAKAAAQTRADSLAAAEAADSVRIIRADSLMANAYPALYAVQNLAEMRNTILPLIDSMKSLNVNPTDIQYFKDQARVKKHELDSLAKLNLP